MNEEDFYKMFWNIYIQLENELIDTFKYIEFSVDNYKTYSSKFVKIFLQIGSEIDVCFKEYLKFFNLISSDSINEYRNDLKTKDIDFFDEIVEINKLKITIKPWENLKNNSSVLWWIAYNKVKHERVNQVKIGNIKQEAYKFANLENVMTSLSGLYVLLMNIFAKIKTNREDSPVPNSRLFKMRSKRWDDCKYFQKIYMAKVGEKFYLDNAFENLINQ